MKYKVGDKYYHAAEQAISSLETVMKELNKAYDVSPNEHIDKALQLTEQSIRIIHEGAGMGTFIGLSDSFFPYIPTGKPVRPRKGDPFRPD